MPASGEEEAEERGLKTYHSLSKIERYLWSRSPFSEEHQETPCKYYDSSVRDTQFKDGKAYTKAFNVAQMRLQYLMTVPLGSCRMMLWLFICKM